MNECPLISVIVPIYKTEQYLNTCIDSIINQTYENLEIILVNDGSPDNSLEICRQYAAKDKRIKIINRTNGGLSAARNSGLDCASGEYIAFVDSDDFIEPIMYELLLQKMTKFNADISQGMATSSHAMFFPQSGISSLSVIEKTLTWREAAMDLLDSGKSFTCSVWNKLYKRELFEGLRFTDVVSEDFVINYRILKEKKPFVVSIDTSVYHYIKREASITTGRLKIKNFEFLELLHKMQSLEIDPELMDHWKIQMAVSGRNIIIRQIQTGDFPEQFESLRKDMINAMPVILKRKFRNIDKTLKYHVLLIWLSAGLYKLYIRAKCAK